MQVLVDTSIWVDFFRKRPGSEKLRDLLELGRVITHPLIIGELQMGDLPKYRKQVIEDLRNLPSVPVVTDALVSDFIENKNLFSTGLSYVDAVLICSAKAAGIPLMTSDKLLSNIYRQL